MKLIALAVLCLATIPVSYSADTWPQWRGPDRNCQTTSPAWPTDLQPENLKQVFRVTLGDSYSGPIVTEDRIFVTETVQNKEAVRALDRTTGEELWKAQWSGSLTVPFFAAANGSWIRSTPAFADGRLYVASMEDVLVCLNAADGTELWRKDFRKEFGSSNQSFGFVCSPLPDEGSVIVQTAAGLVKLDGQTGQVIWRSLDESGGMMGGAFSSPVIATIANFRQLVVQTRQKLCGVDLATGRELWSVKIPAFRGMNILTPTVIGNDIFTSSYGGGSMMVRVSRTNDTFDVAEVWKARAEAYMSSPVVVDGQLYVHLRNQRLTCLNPTSGESSWTSKPYGKYWSMAANGRSVLALDERGDLLLLDLNPKQFTLVDSRHISDAPAWAHLAVAGNQIFVRDLKGLTVFEWAGQ